MIRNVPCTIKKSSSCTDTLIMFSPYFTIYLTRSLMKQNLDTEEELFDFSTHVSPYLEK